jgi:hypothetical protein
MACSCYKKHIVNFFNKEGVELFQIGQDQIGSYAYDTLYKLRLTHEALIQQLLLQSFECWWLSSSDLYLYCMISNELTEAVTIITSQTSELMASLDEKQKELSEYKTNMVNIKQYASDLQTFLAQYLRCSLCFVEFCGYFPSFRLLIVLFH